MAVITDRHFPRPIPSAFASFIPSVTAFMHATNWGMMKERVLLVGIPLAVIRRMASYPFGGARDLDHHVGGKRMQIFGLGHHFVHIVARPGINLPRHKTPFKS
jgi:hypothetical protein